MWQNNRPEGWKNPFDASYIVEIKGHKVCYHSLFEAGADAMLEALRAMGTDPKQSLGLKSLFQNHRIVFIPNMELKYTITANIGRERARILEEHIKLHLQPKPWWLPNAVWKKIIKRLLVLEFFEEK